MCRGLQGNDTPVAVVIFTGVPNTAWRWGILFLPCWLPAEQESGLVDPESSGGLC